MKAEFGQNRSFRQVYGSPPAGQFALENAKGQCQWDHCREQFAQKWDHRVDGFYYSHEGGQSENVAGFISKTETILDLDPPRSAYNKTDKDTILWVAPADFWRICDMRRSLFTILLRCGMRYNTDNDDYERALFGSADGPIDKDQEYALETAPAIKRFLFGFTHYVPSSEHTFFYYKSGWRETFKNRDVPQVRQMLVRPDGQKMKTLIGLDAIWA